MMQDLFDINMTCSHGGIELQEHAKDGGWINPLQSMIFAGLTGGGKSNVIKIFERRNKNKAKHIVGFIKFHGLDSIINTVECDIPPIKTNNFDNIRHLDFAYSKYMTASVCMDEEINSDKLFFIEGDRTKAIATDIIRHGGSGVHICDELKSKIIELANGGDKAAAQFLIKLADSTMSAMRYSTKNKSTPSISNKKTALIAACTPGTIQEVMKEGGLDGVLRRVSVCPAPIFRIDPSAVDEDFGEIGIDEDLRSVRDLALWIYIHTEYDDNGKPQWREEIPRMKLAWKSERITMERRLKKEQKVSSDDIVWPDNYLNEDGKLITENYTANDIYYDLCKKQFIESEKVQEDITKSALFFSEIPRWASKAHALSIKQALNRINDKSCILDEGELDYSIIPRFQDYMPTFEISASAARDALKIERLLSKYSHLLTEMEYVVKKNVKNKKKK
eukprot:440054_1